MILLVCVDDALGMAFNHRRQSMDRALRDRLRTVCAGKNLFLSPYSMKQFEKDQADTDLTMEASYSAATASSGTASTALPVRFHADDYYLSQAGAGDFCFVETDDVLPLESQAEAIILYRWNRHYPSDLTFRIPLAGHGWRLTAVTEFPGFSHERITEEVYKK